MTTLGWKGVRGSGEGPHKMWIKFREERPGGMGLAKGTRSTGLALETTEGGTDKLMETTKMVDELLPPTGAGKPSPVSGAIQPMSHNSPAPDSQYRLAWMWVTGWQARLRIADDLVQGCRQTSNVDEVACIAPLSLGVDIRILDSRTKACLV